MWSTKEGRVLQIVDLMNIVYCLAELVEFAAFVYLRYSAPNLHRPYQVPLPGWGCGLLLLPASAFLVTIIVMPIVARDWKVSMRLTLIPVLSFL